MVEKDRLDIAMAKTIQQADWVTCKSPSSGRMVGFVKRLAKDGSWADVD